MIYEGIDGVLKNKPKKIVILKKISIRNMAKIALIPKF